MDYAVEASWLRIRASLVVMVLFQCPKPLTSPLCCSSCHEAWAPVLLLSSCLSINPQHALGHQIVDHGPPSCCLPAQIVHQHPYAHISQNLCCLDRRCLIIAQLSWHTSNILLSADLDYCVAPSKWLECFDCAANIILRNGICTLHAASLNLLFNLTQANKSPILPPSPPTNLHDPNRQLKIEIIHRPPQQLRPHRLPTTATRRRRRSKRIYPNRSTHARKLRSKGRIGADVLCVGLCELLEEGAEDGELGFEGGGVGG